MDLELEVVEVNFNELGENRVEWECTKGGSVNDVVILRIKNMLSFMWKWNCKVECYLKIGWLSGIVRVHGEEIRYQEEYSNILEWEIQKFWISENMKGQTLKMALTTDRTI